MPPNPWPHHLETYRKLTAYFQKDPNVVALIFGGSIAKGWAREDSDVDFMLIVTDEEYQRASTANDLPFLSNEFTDYPGGYVDGKKVDIAFLRDVASHGSEPARSAFIGATVAFTKDPEVATLVESIPVYPEEGHDDRLTSFYSQVMLLGWFVGEAEKRNDRYLMAFATTELALYAMRTILALNKRIYPYHKWVTRAVSEVPNKPEAFLEKIDAMLASPSKETSQAVIDSISTFREWNIPWQTFVQRFLEDREWNWRTAPAPLPDR